MALAMPRITLPSSAPLLMGELLYSGCARLCGINVLEDTRAAMGLLTGGRNFEISADLPCHLQAVFERIGRLISATSPDDLIANHTLYSYYRVFMPRNRWPEVREIALGDQGGRLKAKIGMLAHGIFASPVLRSCGACAAESLRRHGIAYWHCMHNLPGVIACAQHGVVLTGSFSQSQLGHRARLVMPTQRVGAALRKATPAQVQIAEISRDLLLYVGDSIEPHVAADVYAAAIRELGLTRGTTQLALDPIVALLRQRFARCFDTNVSERFLLDAAGRMSWLVTILGGRDRLTSPLAHIMLIAVLFGSFDRFLEACKTSWEGCTKSKPITTSPVCCEPARFAHARELLGDEALSCRQIAQTCGVSVGWVIKHRQTLGIAIKVRPKRLYSDSKSNVRGLLRDGSSVADVARRLRLSASTVYRLLDAELGLAQQRESSDKDHLRAMHRDKWLTLCRDHPDAGTNLLRSINGATYAWLYRHDREWLRLNAPPKAVPPHPTRIDWQARDEKLARDVALLPAPGGALAKRMLTPAGVAALVYPQASLRMNAARLPRFMEAVNDSSASAG